MADTMSGMVGVVQFWGVLLASDGPGVIFMHRKCDIIQVLARCHIIVVNH